MARPSRSDGRGNPHRGVRLCRSTIALEGRKVVATGGAELAGKASAAQPVVKEEIKVGKRTTHGKEQVEGTVRKEDIKIEKRGNPDVTER